MTKTDRAARVAANYKTVTGLELVEIDATDFMEDLQGVAAAITNQLEREGSRVIPHPFMSLDFGMTLRHCRVICNLFTSLNAEDRLERDPACKQEYSFAILPLIRSLIDGLYNVTVVLEDRALAHAFRASGYKQVLLDSERDARRYGTDTRFLDHHELTLKNLKLEWHLFGFAEEDIRAAGQWKTLGKYLGTEPRATPHKSFLRLLTLGYWKEYSALSHGTHDGLRSIAPFINKDLVPRDMRENVEAAGYRHITLHMARAHGILLCLLTELQAAYSFRGHRINERLASVWASLCRLSEIRELYELRYKNLMLAMGITLDNL